METEQDQSLSPAPSHALSQPTTTTSAPTLSSSLVSFATNRSRLEKSFQKLQDDPYDIETWNTVLRYDPKNTSPEDFRDAYEKFLKVFPTSGKHWKMYIEFEIRMGQPEKTEALFQRCLLKVLNLDLWKTYLAYMKEAKKHLPDYKDIMTKSYEFTLEHVGFDINSASVWLEYIDFLKSQEAVGVYAEGVKMENIRRIYQKAVVNPILQVEDLWKGYDAYENGLNRVTAKKILGERSAAYMSARTVCKERKNLLDSTPKFWLAVPPTGTPKEIQMATAWRKYINYEKSNPLKLQETNALIARVMYAYKQCLLSMYHHPYFWMDAATFLEEQNQKEHAGSLLEEAAQALPLNLLLTLFYIEFEEKRKAFEKCKTLFETFVKAAQTEIDRVKTNAPSSSSSSASSASSSSTDTAETSSSEATETNKKDEEEDAFLNKLLSLCYIRYMMFVCRTEGIKNARTIFRTAREDTRSTYHVYVAAALMEYHHGNTVVAIKIFRLAIQSGGFKNNQELILSYLDFQSSLNEDDATRAAFSEMTSQLDKSKAKEVWSRYLSFESDHGSLTAALDVETKMRNLYGPDFETNPSSIVAHTAINKFSFLNLFPCSSATLESIDYQMSGTALSGFGSAKLFSGASSLPSISNPSLPSVSGNASAFPMPDVSQMTPYKIDATEFLKARAAALAANTSGVPGTSTMLSSTTLPTSTASPVSIPSMPQPPPIIPGPNPGLAGAMPVGLPNTNNNPALINGGGGGSPMLSGFGGADNSAGADEYNFPVRLLPPAIAQLLRLLPPPDSFTGPFVSVNELMGQLASVILPDPSAWDNPMMNMNNVPNANLGSNMDRHTFNTSKFTGPYQPRGGGRGRFSGGDRFDNTRRDDRTRGFKRRADDEDYDRRNVNPEFNGNNNEEGYHRHKKNQL